MLRFLVTALPLLVLTFAALLGGAEVAAAMGDSTGRVIMRRLAACCLLLLTIDALALLMVLGAEALSRRDGGPEGLRDEANDASNSSPSESSRGAAGPTNVVSEASPVSREELLRERESNS